PPGMKKTCRASFGRSGWLCATDTSSRTNQFVNSYPGTIERTSQEITGRTRFTSNFVLKENLRDIAHPITSAATIVSSKRINLNLRRRSFSMAVGLRKDVLNCALGVGPHPVRIL